MEAAEEGARSFGVILAGLEDGQLQVDLTAKCHDLTSKLAAAAVYVGKAKGEICLKLKLSADAGGTVQIDADIVVKEPKALRARSVLWLTKGHNLVGENPRQTRLALRDINPTAPPREVPKPAAPPRTVLERP